jgi:hypothetical protein
VDAAGNLKAHDGRALKYDAENRLGEVAETLGGTLIVIRYRYL